jgi:multiple sugar transport system substrate-binding protein
MMKKIVSLLVVLMTSAALVFAGGGGQQSGGSSGTSASPASPAAPGTVTLRWAFWGSETRVQQSQAAINAFEAANPGIKVNIEVSGGTGDHFNKVDTQLAGGAGPDIIQMGGNFPDYVAKNAILNLNPYKGGVLNVSTIDTGAIDAGSVGGRLYGVSTGATIPALIYNKSLLQRVGAPLPAVSQTWEVFRAYLATIKPLLPAGTYPLMDFGSTSSGSTGFGYWTSWNGTPIYDEVSGTTKVTAADAKRFLDLFKDYRDNAFIPPADISAGYAETNVDSSSLIAGKVAIGFIVSNQFANYQAAIQDELDLIELPGAVATKALWPQLSQVYTINAASPNLDAAVRFVNFLVNSPEAGRIIGNDRGISSSSTFRQGASAVATAADQKVFAYHDVAGPHTSPETAHLPNDTELNSTLNLIYQRVAFGQANTTQGAQEIYDLLVRLSRK